MHTSKEEINGINILLRNWLIAEPKATVLLVHGYGEHSGRYEETASKLNDAGYSVYTYDRRGEGQTDGLKGHIQSMNNHVSDLIEVRKRVDVKGKFFLMAHSLGGLVCMTYLLDHKPTDIDGVILSSPFIKIDDGTAPILQKLAGIVAAIFPKMPTVGLDVNLISRDPAEVAKYVNDPFVYHGKTNAKTGYEMIKAIKNVQSKFSEFDLPFIIIHGSKDKLADPQGSKWLFERSISKDKKLVILDGLYHETMREPEKEQFFGGVLDWLSARD
jgi:alpha-beta hydrolase superfamily lysophospholipase